MKTRGSLVETIFISMISIAVISILVLGSLMVHYEYVNFHRDSDRLRDEFMKEQKSTIKNEVDKAVDYIEYMKSKQKEGLQVSLKNKAHQAYDIAMNIYNENKGAKSLTEVKKLVKDALEPIRFNGRRGDYFAIQLDGAGQLFSDRPEMEGKNILGMRDAKGKYIIQDMIGIVKDKTEGFYEYTWTKNEKEGMNFPKLTYIRFFKPFNWLIGAGEYLDDDEIFMQKQILDRISDIRFGKDGYIFIVTYDGVTLMNDIQGDLIGKNIWELTDPNGVKVIQEERKAVENPDGGFINYVWNKPSEVKTAARISFIKGIKDWQWMVGAGAYVDEIDKIISQNKKSLEERVRHQLIKVALLLLFLMTMTYLAAKFISLRIDKSLVTFSSFFQRAAAESTKIDLNGINFSEFKALAGSANSMLEKREQTEMSLRENEEKYRTLFDMETDALALSDVMNGDILDANKAFVELFGYSRNEILAMKNTDFSTGVEPIYGECPDDRAYVCIIYPRKKDGSIFPVEINTRNIKYQGKDLQLMVVRDMSERKRLEAQLRQAQKMEAIGTLAGGIAHDFNNILLPILGHTEMLMMGLPPESHIQYNLQQIYQAGNRAKEMIKQILAFSRKDRQEKKPVQLGPIITEAVALLRGSLPTTIDIQYDITTKDDTALANSIQIHQVILNLCTNAAQAMREKGGQLRIALDDFILDQKLVHMFRHAAPGQYLKLTVMDSGTGIAPDIMDKVFEPYFTTKNTGEGTGMGLAVVHGIVLDHQGDVSVESETGKGTTFAILLPMCKSTEGKKEISIGSPAEVPGGNEKILLVDDEFIVVDVLQSMMENMGYIVTSHTNSIEALETFRKSPGKFDLVITDMTMPNMTGKDLAMELLAIRSDVPVILCTGFSEQIDEESAKTIGINAFLMKPVLMSEVAKTIRSVLDQKARFSAN